MDSTERVPVRMASDAGLRLVLLHDETGAEVAIPAGDVIEVRAPHLGLVEALHGKALGAGAEVATVNRLWPESRGPVTTIVLETVAQVVAACNATVSGAQGPLLVLFQREGAPPKLVEVQR